MSLETSQFTEMPQHISDLKAQVDTLEAKNASLEAHVASLEAKVATLEAKNAPLEAKIGALEAIFDARLTVITSQMSQMKVQAKPHRVNVEVASEHVTRVGNKYKCDICGVTWPLLAAAHKPNGPKCQEIREEGINKKKSLPKKVLCKNWTETGGCPFGTNCKYAHGESELRV